MSGNNDDTGRSRSDLSRERKGEENRLAALATSLVDMSGKQFAKLTLDDDVQGAVDEARRMTTHAARARQMRVVRRALRGVDNVAIAEAVNELLNPHGRPSPAARATQVWVDRFLDEGNETVELFLADHEHADRQHLKGLLRNLRKADPGKTAKARKALATAVQAIIQTPTD